MWFKSLDQKQFMLYAQQSARLNTAYWLAALTSHKCEEEEATPIVRAEIEGFKRQIALMLKHVRKDVRKQRDLPLGLIKHELAYVALFCRQYTKNTNRRLLFSKIGIPIAGDDLILDKETTFIRERSNIVDEDDLLGQWDRAIYLTYESISLKEQSLFGRRRVIAQRIDAAQSLMEPEPMAIAEYCRAYTGHLGLDPFQASELLERLALDVTNMYAMGLELVTFSRALLLRRQRVIASVIDRGGLGEYVETMTQKAAGIQKRLIEANLARTDTIRRAIDMHVVA